LDLVGLYARTNQQLLENEPETMPRKLVELAGVLKEIQDVFEVLEARVKDEQGFVVG